MVQKVRAWRPLQQEAYTHFSSTKKELCVTLRFSSFKILTPCKIWSCGVNDDAALGRITKDVPDPENPGSFIDADTLTATPHPIQTLVDEKFRAVRIATGDSISAAVSDNGELRVWGSFRVSGSTCISSLLADRYLVGC